jgi:hypothetical protein
MNPRHWRQPQIIRSLAATPLLLLAVLSVGVSAQDRPAACVSCLVIAVEDSDFGGLASLPAGSLDGVQLIVPSSGSVNQARTAGANVAILVAPESGSPQQVAFAARTAITALRAERPGVQIAIDGAAFSTAGVTLEELRPYVDAVIGENWMRLPPLVRPTVDDLTVASLTPGAERVLLPVRDIDWAAVQEFAARRPPLVEVTGARRLTVAEILARHQAEQRRQDEVIKTTIATGTMTLLFEVPDFAAPITITADTVIYRGSQGSNIEARDIRVNGASITGGGAGAAPELPLIEAERISTPPLTITLDEAYTYTLGGDDTVGGSRCYVVSFEPRTSNRGLARGRAWIDARDFTLRRLQTIQKDLRGAIVSSEEVDEFGRVDVSGTTVWLPMETRIFQSYEGAGLRTPIHRNIAIRHYDVNSATFEAQLAAALASNNVMMRDTPEGLRYLVRRGNGSERSTVTRGGHSIRSIIGGLLADPGISRPLAFAGLSYVNLDLFGRGAQLNVFFGGVFGQASWSVPSIAGSRWQAHGSAFGIAAQFTDRVFRNGREQYAENLQQQPGYASVGVLHPLTPRVRVTLDYTFDMTALERTVNTPPLFVVPRSVVNHGVVLGIEAVRGAWTVGGWWNPVVRYRWSRWGLPGGFDPSTRDYQRYGVRLRRTLALASSVSSRLELAWMGGHDLDRFSRYGFDSFDNVLHGYPTAAIRYDRGAVLRSATGWTWRGIRLDGFGDTAVVQDPGWASDARFYPGIGTGVESGGPFRTLLSLEWAYGFRAPRQDGGRGTQTVKLTVYKPF